MTVPRRQAAPPGLRRHAGSAAAVTARLYATVAPRMRSGGAKRIHAMTSANHCHHADPAAHRHAGRRNHGHALARQAAYRHASAACAARRHPGATGWRGRADEHLGTRLRPEPLQPRPAGSWHALPEALFDGAGAARSRSPRQRWRLRSDVGAAGRSVGLRRRPGEDRRYSRCDAPAQRLRDRIGWQRIALRRGTRARACNPGGVQVDLSRDRKGLWRRCGGGAICAERASTARWSKSAANSTDYGRKPDGNAWRVLVEAVPATRTTTTPRVLRLQTDWPRRRRATAGIASNTTAALFAHPRSAQRHAGRARAGRGHRGRRRRDARRRLGDRADRDGRRSRTRLRDTRTASGGALRGARRRRVAVRTTPAFEQLARA